jgi:hypothetical protein
VAEMVIDKIYELEEADLRKVAEAIGKRLQNL